MNLICMTCRAEYKSYDGGVMTIYSKRYHYRTHVLKSKDPKRDRILDDRLCGPLVRAKTKK